MASRPFDLRLFASFVAAAEELHVGRAAVRLGLTEATVSRQLARLDRHVGTALLCVDDRSIAVTAAGERFLAEARSILHRAEAAETALGSGKELLRVHLGGAVVDPAVIGTVSTFMVAHPEVALQAAHGPSMEVARALSAGDAEVAFEWPGGVPDGFSYATFRRGFLGVLTRAGHLAAAAPIGRWSQLEGERIIFAPPGIADSWNTAVRVALRRTGIRHGEVIGPRVPEPDYLAHQVTAGHGIMILAPWCANPLPEGLAWTELAPRQATEIGVIWNDTIATPAVRQFVAWASGRGGAADSGQRSTAGGTAALP